MSRVELVIPERDVIPVTETLIGSSLFHLSSTVYAETQENGYHTPEWQEQATEFAALEQRLGSVLTALDLHEPAPPSEHARLIELSDARSEVARLEQEVQRPIDIVEEIEREIDQRQRYLDELEPLAELEADLDALRNTEYVHIILGVMPTANIERFRSSLELIPFALVPLHSGEHLTTVALFGRRSDADILERAARSAYVNPLNPPDRYHGTPGAAISALNNEIAELRQRDVEGQEVIQNLRETHGPELRQLLQRVQASRMLTHTIAGLGRLHYTYLASGWVPSVEVPALEQQIRAISPKILIEVDTPRRQEGGYVPVSLKNPPLIRLFQGLVTTYGYPSYAELDPTPLIALTFPLIFGLMFGDIGHGLVLALLGLLLASRRVQALRGLASLGGIMVICGVASTVFGFLYGSLFGFEDVIAPLWLRPLNQITDILIVTVGIGTVLLTVGMVQNLINAALVRQWGRFLFDRNGLMGLIFYWSVLGIAVGTLMPNLPIPLELLSALAVFGGLALLLSEPLERWVEGEHPLIQGSLGTYLIEAFVELFETAIGLFSNTLSYVRIGAFAVAHGALSMVVFLIAEIVGPARGVGYWIVVLFGNLFVIGFEGMIVGIQTLRLEYYEFFNKFFSGGGMRYRPLQFGADNADH
jgi:V/A-type H+-transporting ATPase subunit I